MCISQQEKKAFFFLGGGDLKLYHTVLYNYYQPLQAHNFLEEQDLRDNYSISI